jgi:hypothetical protein
VVLVYLEGAGKPIVYQTTFKSGMSWVERKWTAQETPKGPKLVLASGNHCMDGDFFELCEEKRVAWHANHQKITTTLDKCRECTEIQRRLEAIRVLRDEPDDIPSAVRIENVAELVRGRHAGCAADQVFCLLNLLRVADRPVYDPRYSIEQAARLLFERLPTEYLPSLKEERHASWFDGIFSAALRQLPIEGGTHLAAFQPKMTRTTAGTAFDRSGSYELRGTLAPRQRVSLLIEDEYIEHGYIDMGPAEPNSTCAWQKVAASREDHSLKIHLKHIMWHGIGACCTIVTGDRLSEEERTMCCDASHVLLSANCLEAVLISRPLQSNSDETEFKLIRSSSNLVFRVLAKYTVILKSVKLASITINDSTISDG